MLSLRRHRRVAADTASTLYAGAVERSRRIELYTIMGAPDTVEGRFELLTAHILLLVERLNREGDPGRALGQSLFDLYIRNLDSALREMGVGDLAVGKRMKQLGKVFYGRGAAFASAFQAGNRAELDSLISRTLLVDRDHADPRALAEHLTAERARLANTSFDDLKRGLRQ